MISSIKKKERSNKLQAFAVGLASFTFHGIKLLFYLDQWATRTQKFGLDSKGKVTNSEEFEK